mmetsp:Transcript_19274/g.36275  ORF Transcript_19274/g.36275 Transcript_19274/m.36275 type:complete len:134 (+) Transcript_19274:92-493(+)
MPVVPVVYMQQGVMNISQYHKQLKRSQNPAHNHNPNHKQHRQPRQHRQHKQPKQHKPGRLLNQHQKTMLGRRSSCSGGGSWVWIKTNNACFFSSQRSFRQDLLLPNTPHSRLGSWNVASNYASNKKKTTGTGS